MLSPDPTPTLRDNCCVATLSSSMSFTVDDLVASLSTNHIGQEAIDLAALQAQLSQSLYTPAQNVATYHKAGQGHCNTPLARTPSASFSWSDRSHGDLGYNRNSRSSSVVGIHRQRQNSIDEGHAYYYNGGIVESDEDEQMVEDMLCPSSPMSSGTPSATSCVQFPYHPRSPGGPGDYVSGPPSPTSPPDNHFVTTDPFYLAQLQQQRQQAQTVLASSSIFSQMGRPTPHSPFSQPSSQPQYYNSHHQQFPAREIDHHHAHANQHSLLVGAAAFDR